MNISVDVRGQADALIDTVTGEMCDVSYDFLRRMTISMFRIVSIRIRLSPANHPLIDPIMIPLTKNFWMNG